MTAFRSRDGKPMELMEWAMAYEDDGYRIIKQTECEHGVLVSTIWEGIVLPWKGTFSTCVFQGDIVVVEFRSDSEDEATSVHEEVVATIKSGEFMGA